MFETDLRAGSSGPVVEQLQKFLTYEGTYGKATITGTFDAATKQAVIAFQKKYGIKPAIGYVGVKTRHKMRQLTGL